MPELDSHELLAQYVRDKSEEAFAALVSRHLNLVYSVALRHVSDPHQAEDITQVVFLLLAKKASSLSHKIILSGWLYRTTQLTAANYLRMEKRRQRREQEAHMQSLTNESGPDVWSQIAPLLDVAMERLGNGDRDAVVLRFFEGKSFDEIGGVMGTSEAAAQKRVERALVKLRSYFMKRGVTLSAATLTGVLLVNSVQAAPVGLAEAITAAGLTNGAAISGTCLTLMKSTLKIMTWLKIKTAVVASISAVLITSATTVAIAKIEKSMANSSQISKPATVVPPSSNSNSQHTQATQPSILNKQVSAYSFTATQSDQGNTAASSSSEYNENTQGNPQDAGAYIRRGRSYLSKGDYDHAIDDFNQALLLNPKSAAAYFSRGRANKLKGNYEQARLDYDQAIALNPTMVAAYVNRGQIHNIAGDYDQAIIDFNQAIQLDSERPIPYLDRGVSFESKGNYERAITDLNFAIKIDPEFSPACNNLAWLLATCPQPTFRDGKKAVLYATKACALSEWNNMNQLDTLAAAYAEEGDFENAVKWESKILEAPNLAPEDITIARQRLALYQSHQPYHRKEISTSPNNQ